MLDPVFISPWAWVCAAAPWPPCSARWQAALMQCGFLLFSKRAPISITFGGYSLRVMGRVLALGFSPFIIIAMDNVMIIAMNALLQRYGGAAQGDMLLTCATIAQSFMLVVTMPLGGITGGTQSILGYNYGACNTARVKQAVRTVMKLCVGYTLVMTLAGFAAGGLFARLFSRDAAVLEQAARAIRICVLSIVPLGVQYEIVDGFTALGQAQIALPLVLAQGRVLCGAVRPARRVRRTGHLLRRARF